MQIIEGKYVYILTIWLIIAFNGRFCSSLDDDVDLSDAYNSDGNAIDMSSSMMSHHSVDLMSDWDSGLYGKPICTKIPSNMSLCANLNYDRMKVPNLLGHDTIEEIVYQSSAWKPLLSIQCHPDAKLFLCSMFAPICVSDSSSQTIYPCRSLCMAVKTSCESKMLAYNYPWPSQFNCSRFPDDNGLCISTGQPDRDQEDVVTTTTRKRTTTTSTTTTTTTTTTTQTITPKTTKIPKKNPSTNRPNRPTVTPNSVIDFTGDENTCYGCQNDEFSMARIVKLYCNADIALRGRIQTIKISGLGPVSPNQRRKNAKVATTNSTIKSLYIRIAKKDRKFLKGGKLVANLEEYLTESGYHSNQNEEEVDDLGEETETTNAHSSSELDIYLMSRSQLMLNHYDRQSTRELAKKRLRFAPNVNVNNTSGVKHCVCEKLRKTSRRINTKYLLLVNVLKTRALGVIDSSNNGSLRRRFKSIRNADPFRNRYRNRDGWKRGVAQQKQIKLLYLNSMYPWNRVRPFIDYLENDSIDKRDMCKNVKRSVTEIYRTRDSLF